MRQFEFDPLIFTPTIGNLKTKMGEDCGFVGGGTGKEKDKERKRKRIER